MLSTVITAAMFATCPGHTLPDPCATPGVSCTDPADLPCAEDCQDDHRDAIKGFQDKHETLWCDCNGNPACEIQRDAQYLARCLDADFDLAECVAACGCSIVVSGSSTASVDAALRLLANFE